VAAAMPRRIAISGVTLPWLAVPRIPSVPKIFRAVIVPHSTGPADAKAADNRHADSRNSITCNEVVIFMTELGQVLQYFMLPIF
jgi:hypothetical protein